MPHIFITGASGYIGSMLTSLAIFSGHTVTALSRSEQSDAHLLSLGATPIRGDLTTHSILASSAAAADVTIGLADAIAGRIGQITQEERNAINKAAFQALADGIKGTSKKLIITSGTLFAAADPQGNETDEESPPWPKSPFGEGMEGAFTALRDAGVNVNVVRLAPWVYGRGGSGVKGFMQGAKHMGEMVYVGDGAGRTTTVHVDDAAKLYLLVAEKGKPGEVYNATSETDVTFRGLAEAMGRVMGVSVQWRSYEEMEGMVGPFLANFLRLENRASSAKARKELGWTVEAKKGILEEIERGSYVELAEELKKA